MKNSFAKVARSRIVEQLDLIKLVLLIYLGVFSSTIVSFTLHLYYMAQYNVTYLLNDRAMKQGAKSGRLSVVASLKTSRTLLTVG